MASLSYYVAFMISFAATILVASHGKVNCHSKSALSLEILRNSTKAAMDKVSIASPDFAVNGMLEKLIVNNMPNDRLGLSALGSCRQILSLALHNLNRSFSLPQITSAEARGNLKTWTCAVSADLASCLDGFRESAEEVKDFVFRTLKGCTDDVSNIMGIISQMDRCLRTKARFVGKNLVSDHHRDPLWLSSNDRRLMESANVKANLVVAKDGTGNYSKISDAMKAIPSNSTSRFVIYVKRGVYYENTKIDVYQWNVMMFGDGMNDTIVSGNRSHGDGFDTFSSATFSVLGQGFIARDMGFLNTAGPTKEQAVALVSAADQSIFYRCRIDSYQDTLYAKSNRQFYRECNIYGTIDFIFGNASVVIQNSTILAKRPLRGQKNTITAHGKTNQNCATGIVIQASNVRAAEDLTGVRTFLGRPWKSHSTSVFLQNYMESLIDPEGWAPWDEMGGPPPGTVFMAEYSNKGPGANVARRVKWNGVRVNLSFDEANEYTVRSMINGDQWLPATNVTYNSGL